MGNLREWRKSKGITQEDLADQIGEKRANYANWESGRTSFPSSVQEKIRKLGYDGSWPKEESDPTPLRTIAEEYTKRRMEEAVPRTLPKHIQQAYIVVKEAVVRGRGDLMAMDDPKIGLVIGLVAQEIALGRSVEEAREALVEQAELLVGLKAQ